MKLLRGDRRKDEQTLQVEVCQILPLDHETALLRVSVRWGGGPLADIAVRLPNGNLVTPVAPGAVASADGVLSAGFMVPAAAAGTELVLVTPVGAVLLPLPQALSGGPADRREDVDNTLTVEEQLRQRCELTEHELEELRGKLVQAWGEVAQMREAVNGREADYRSAEQFRSQADAIVAELEERAQRSEAELAATRHELQAECQRLQAELAGREDAGAQAADLLERFEAARTRADQLDKQLAEARALAEGAMDVASKAARELIAERAKVEEAVDHAERQGERLARSERELAEARAELAVARETLATAETDLEALRAQVAENTEAETEAAKQAERIRELEAEVEAAREGIEKLKYEQAQRQFAEAHATENGERVRELEAEVAEARERVEQLEQAREEAPEPEQPEPDGEAPAVEEDLRHLLATRQRELDETRAELKEQRARYAAVASKMTPEELAATTETRPPENDWTALDDELLDRLARAKELSQQD